MSIELYEHQLTALNYLRLNDGFALFLDQGLGKTFPILFRLEELARTGRIQSALIVAPASVCASWHDKIAKLDFEQQVSFSKIRFEIVSYDLLWRRKEYYGKVWDAVVLDESHYIKSPSAKRTKACLKVCSMAYYRYILTGTPMSNGHAWDMWSQMAAIDPITDGHGHIYPRCFGGDSYYKWIDRIAYINQYHKPYKCRNLPAIQEAVSGLSYRLTKEEALTLPDKMPDEIIHVKLSAKGAKDYREMARHSAIEALDTLAGNPLTRALRLRTICSGYLDTDGGKRVEYSCGKPAALRTILEGTEEKVVVYCNFTYSIQRVEALCDDMGLSHVTLDGRQQDKGVWRQFQEDPGVRVFIGQYQSANAGIDLYASRTMVFYEPPLSSVLLEQSRDRIHRIGQSRACAYYFLLTDGSIERAIYSALKSYEDFDEGFFGQYLKEVR